MSTRSMICMKDEGDKYKCIYCHSDGYLEHNGAILIDHYKDKEKLISGLRLKYGKDLNWEMIDSWRKVYARKSKYRNYVYTWTNRMWKNIGSV